MYSGTTFRTKSGRVMGVHQKIDRASHRHITKHIPKSLVFPTVREILHFEGLNGPDGIKRKSPAKDEPWHYNDHIYNMSVALRDGNHERAAFEAAWLAHAVADGLTPAHHYPLDEKIEELWGKPKEERLTIRDKNFIRGKSRRDTFSKNWEYWGAKGVFTNHFMFEWGVATSITPLRFDDTEPTPEEFARIKKDGFEVMFLETLHRIADLEMYKEFARVGWSRRLARETKDVLIPEIIKMVTLAWYQAVLEAK